MAGQGVHRPVLNGSYRCASCHKVKVIPTGSVCAQCITTQKPYGAASQIIELERDLRKSIRGGYLFGNFDEPLDAAGLRIVRVIQQRLSDLPCECTDRTPDAGGYRCRACGGRIIEA